MRHSSACILLPSRARFLQVVVLDKLDYCATLNNLESVRHLKNFRFVKGDIQCMDLVSHVLEKEEIDTVMHFAAQVRSCSAPQQSIRTQSHGPAVSIPLLPCNLRPALNNPNMREQLMTMTCRRTSTTPSATASSSR